jgi:hypothetical protein
LPERRTLPERPGFPERTLAIRRATARLCLRLNWVPLHEVSLPNGRRADILALRGDGGFVCIEVKSGPRDFLTDQKWWEYREFSDRLFFAVDLEFPVDLLPAETGLIVVADQTAELIHDAPEHKLSAARRTALLRRWALLAGTRLAIQDDPAGIADLRASLRVE